MAYERLTRAEQAGRNRQRVLAAAAEVFVEQGFAAARIEEIAARAGFTRGAVYSQFTDKADLFLTLLEARRDWRSELNRASAELAAEGGWEGFAWSLVRLLRSEPEWNLAILEFRTIAARNPLLNDRYSRLHAGTVDELARALGRVFDLQQVDPPGELRGLATSALALGNGSVIEELASPAPTDDETSVAAFGRLLGFAPAHRAPSNRIPR